MHADKNHGHSSYILGICKQTADPNYCGELKNPASLISYHNLKNHEKFKDRGWFVDCTI